MPANDSVLGGLRDKVLADLSLAADLAGGVHWVELPAAGAESYPGLVLRWPRTRFQYQTPSAVSGTPTRQFVEVAEVELWLETLSAESGEPLLKRVEAVVTDAALSLSDGTSVQVFATDRFLYPQTGRNNDGDKQYSFCLKLDCWLNRER